MSKTFKGKGEKSSVARKVISIIAAVLVIVIVAGTLVAYNIFSGGFIERNTVAAESDNYEVSGAMMTYLFNNMYQNYVSSASSYLSLIGLDTSKDLKSQTTQSGGTWYDYFLSSATSSANQMLVLCEAAKAEGFEVEGLDGEIDEAVDAMKQSAAQYNVTFDYFLKVMYGSSVNESVLRKCLEMSEIASHYSDHMVSQYNFNEDDWNKYFDDNKSSFLKVDWMTYTFTAEAETLGEDATDEEKAAAEAKQDEEYNALLAKAEELKAVTDADSFSAYVEDYLRNVKYAGMDDAALEADKVDIDSIVSGLKKTGNTGNSETDLTKWAFDDARAAGDTYSESDNEKHSVSVYMLLPAENTEDLGFACKYRDAYSLKDFRYIPMLSSDFNDSMDEAKDAAEKALEEYKEDATEDNFAKLASADKYGDGNYEVGLRENADKGAIDTAVDEWLYNSERKNGDVEIIEVSGKGYYIVYYVGDGDIKWQANADSSLKNNKYSEEYDALAHKYVVSQHSKGMKMISVVDLSNASSGSNTGSAS